MIWQYHYTINSKNFKKKFTPLPLLIYIHKSHSFPGLLRESCTLDLADLHTFKDHPFIVADDVKMAETVESIKKYTTVFE